MQYCCSCLLHTKFISFCFNFEESPKSVKLIIANNTKIVILILRIFLHDNTFFMVTNNDLLDFP